MDANIRISSLVYVKSGVYIPFSSPSKKTEKKEKKRRKTEEKKRRKMRKGKKKAKKMGKLIFPIKMF